MSQSLVQPSLGNSRLVKKCSYDIREMIYRLVFQDSPSGRPPDLLVALDDLPIYYQEALRVYFQVTKVNLGRGEGGYQLRGFEELDLLFVVHLEISFRGNSAAIRPNLEARAQKTTRCMENLRDLTLDFSLVTQNSVLNYPRIVEQWLSHFSRLQLIKLVPNLSAIAAPTLTATNGLEEPRPSPQAIDSLNSALRVTGKLANVIGLNDSCNRTLWDQPSFPGERMFMLYRIYKSSLGTRSVVIHDTWFWEVSRGKTLSWNTDDQDRSST